MPTSPIHAQGNTRAEREILHGKHLAVLETETVWGWGTPAGQLRARRRADLIIEGHDWGRGSARSKSAAAPAYSPKCSPAAARKSWPWISPVSYSKKHAPGIFPRGK
jgi:hypothetical protein